MRGVGISVGKAGSAGRKNGVPGSLAERVWAFSKGIGTVAGSLTAQSCPHPYTAHTNCLYKPSSSEPAPPLITDG